jgi:hypothetical protein
MVDAIDRLITRFQTLLLIALYLSPTAVSAACPTPGPDSLVPASDAARSALISRSRIWLDAPYEPTLDPGLSSEKPIHCQFLEPQDMSRPGGTTEKFTCRRGEQELWIRYHRDSEYNPGIWGELLSTRIFWAMGLPADNVYPLQIVCSDCPPEPWLYIYNYFFAQDPAPIFAKAQTDSYRAQLEAALPRARDYVEKHRRIRGEEVFELAQVEQPIDLKVIERCHDQGWDWERDFALEPSGTEERARQLQIEREAFALLMAFIQHADNKSEQQRLVCADTSPAGNEQLCDDPIMMIHDLGFTLGGGWERTASGKSAETGMSGVFSSVNAGKFLAAPLWKDADACVTQVRHLGTGQAVEFRVSEAGRLFLAERLSWLLRDEDTLREIFDLAQVERRPVKVRDDNRRVVAEGYTTDQWVHAFRQRATQVIDHHCPP